MKALDYVTFRYHMPTGRDGNLFRTRDLECTQDHYQVNMQGRLVRMGSTDLLARPLEDLEYSGWLDIVSWAGHFRLEFESGTLKAIQLIDEEEWVEFNSDNCIP